jgi:hypothetical protein
MACVRSRVSARTFSCGHALFRDITDLMQGVPLMGHSRSLLFLTLTIVFTLSAARLQAQEIPELLQPVEPQVIEALMSKSNYGLRSQLYFAKRYRLVRVDFALLERADAEFSITPFADLSARVSTREVQGPSSFEQLREWSGELLSPVSRSYSVESARPMLHELHRVNLWIRSGAHEVPLELVRKIQAERGDATAFGALPDLSSAPAAGLGRVATKMELQTLSGEWLVPARLARMVIQPVEDDPRYHVVYERDLEKTPQGADSPNRNTTEKLKRRAAFMEELQLDRANEQAKQRQLQ